jgi:AhpD family alkylhydroperoxidase
MEISPNLFKAYLRFSGAVRSNTIEQTIRTLVKIRVSQINGCGFCADMHVKEATMSGERALRLHHLAIWRESPLFNERERAALAWAEILTQLPAHGVPEDAYEAARAAFSETEIVDLTYAIIEINGWNRAGVAFRAAPGSKDAAFGLNKAGLS